MGYYSAQSSRLEGFFQNRILRPRTEEEQAAPTHEEWKRNWRIKKMAKSTFTSSDEISLTLNETVLRTLETSLRILRTSTTIAQATSSINERIKEYEKANKELVEAISITYESEVKADHLSSEQFNG